MADWQKPKIVWIIKKKRREIVSDNKEESMKWILHETAQRPAMHQFSRRKKWRIGGTVR